MHYEGVGVVTSTYLVDSMHTLHEHVVPWWGVLFQGDGGREKERERWRKLRSERCDWVLVLPWPLITP